MLRINLVNDISRYQSTLVLLPAMKYNDIITLIPKYLSEEKICYVTLNKTYSSLKELFGKEDINLNSFVFIDAISRTFSEVENTDNCYFVKSPQALTDLSIVITEFLSQQFNYKYPL